MQLKSAALWFGAVLVLISAACGPVGPALGLGPALDPFVGLILLVALVLGAGWLVKSAVRSPAGQAIERQFSETGQAVRDRFMPAPMTALPNIIRATPLPAPKRFFGSAMREAKSIASNTLKCWTI